jgi:dTDP-4-dehydrorhamnose 3,5-epimerase-like enzyme
MTTATLVNFPKHAEDNGVVYVYEGGRHVPFEIQRVFTVTARKGDTRGDHAHKTCAQLLVCVSGRIRVICDNGLIKSEHMLENMETGLLVPAGVWATQEYTTDDAVLMVLCDRRYEAEDYIRDSGDFRKFLSAS